MPKRRRRHGERRQRLYLVFDDWCHGYSIREVNLPLPGGDDHEHEHTAVNVIKRRFPKPLFRMVARRMWPTFFTSALGARILAMHPRDPEGDLPGSYFPMLDVRSRTIAIGPAPEWVMGTIHYLPVGQKLFILSSQALYMLCLDECCPSGDRYSSMEWSWKELSKQPFNVEAVTSYSLLPEPEQHIFLVSTKNGSTEATFAFDTDKLSWKLLGNWRLPFAGRGHYDLDLNGFVGLSREPDTLYCCCCYMPISLNSVEGQCPPPSFNLCTVDSLLSDEQPADMHVAGPATLVYMGSRSKFCLIQCVSVKNDGPAAADLHHKKDDEDDDACLPGHCMYRLTTFSLRLDDGKLTTRKSSKVHYYKVPKATSKSFLVEDPVAFWM
ncbi:hypothetical protein VPH35_114185 [Triticum aestivum]